MVVFSSKMVDPVHLGQYFVIKSINIHKHKNINKFNIFIALDRSSFNVLVSDYK